MNNCFIIAQTQREAQSLKDFLGEPYEDWSVCGVGGATYSTPSAVILRGPITLDARAFDWLMREVHLYSVPDVRWI